MSKLYITRKVWSRYIDTLAKINKKAADDILTFIHQYGYDENGQLLENMDEALAGRDTLFIDYCYEITQKYGNASAAISAQMYDAIAELEKASVPPAELAPNATYHDIAKTVNGVLKTSHNIDEMVGAITRHVKKASCDTMLQNAYRDRAQYAWIPSGDTCAYCLALASNGWVNISARRVEKGYPHAEHIHSNCNCNYMIRHNSTTQIAGYDPGAIDDLFAEAEERAERQGYYTQLNNMDPANVNALRRMQYAKTHNS